MYLFDDLGEVIVLLQSLYEPGYVPSQDLIGRITHPFFSLASSSFLLMTV